MTKRLIAVFLTLLLGSCGSRETDLALLGTNSDQLIWEAGQKAFSKKDWETAREHYKRIVDGFANSPYLPNARLALGDTYFHEGGSASYILAIAEYQEFLNLYPSHSRSDYAQFQVAECYFKQKHGADRDQEPTQRALVEFTRLLELYPQSNLAEEARKRVVACRQTLARAEYVAGYFYQRSRKACRPAITRYQTLLSEYPDYNQLDEVLYRISQCLVATGRGAEAEPHLARLLAEYSRSEYADDAKELLQRVQAKPKADAQD